MVCAQSLSCVQLRDFPNPGIEPRSPALQADALTSEPPGKPKKKAIKLLKIEDKQLIDLV